MVTNAILQRSKTKMAMAVGFIVVGAGLGLAAAYLGLDVNGDIRCDAVVASEQPLETLQAQSQAASLSTANGLRTGITALVARGSFKNQAEDRKAILRGLMRRDPAAARNMVLQRDVRKNLGATTTNCIEQDVRVTGRLEMRVMEGPGSYEAEYFIVDGSSRQQVFGVPDSIRAGATIEVQGVAVDGELLTVPPTENETGVTVKIQAPQPTGVVNLHRPLLVMLGDFSNTNYRTPDLPTMQTVTTNLNSYYAENSYGKLQWDVTVQDWVETSVNRTANCDDSAMLTALIQANDTAVDYSQFNGGDVAVVAPFSGGCHWGGMSYVTPSTFVTADGTVSMTVVFVKVASVTQANIEYILNHELGHNLSGGGHANWAHCPNGQTFPDANCTIGYYEDPYDVMGGWYNPTATEYRTAHFSAERKYWTGWLAPNQIVTLDSGDPVQTIDLSPLEWTDNGVKLIRVRRSLNDYITIEFRQAFLADGITPSKDAAMFQAQFPNVFNGALIRQSNGGMTQLYDASPMPTNDQADATLAVGQSLTDPLTGSVISVVSQSSTTLRVRVTAPLIDLWNPPPPLEIIDGVAADIDETVDATTVTAHWSPITDIGTGLDRYEVGVVTAESDIVAIASNGLATNATFTNLSIPVGTTYYVVVLGVDRKGNVSDTTYSDGVTVLGGAEPAPYPIGTTATSPFPPNCIYVGTEFLESAAGSSTTALKASWCDTPHLSTTVAYAYAIGTTPGGTDITPYTNVGMKTHIVRSGLSLTPGQAYYVVVRSITAAGVAGSIRYSDPYYVDVTAPSSVGEVNDGLGIDRDVSATTNRWQANWTPVSDETPITYYYAVGSTPGAWDVISPTTSTVTKIDVQGIPLAAGQYYTSVMAMDAAGNMSSWNTSDGLTIDPGADVTPPAISVSIPVDGTTVSGVVPILATVLDDLEVLSVQFIVDGVYVDERITAPPYSITWNSTTVVNGAHVITAIATDAVHTTQSAPVAITVTNSTTIPNVPPTSSLTQPLTGTVVSGTVYLQGVSFDGATATFTVDGVELRSPQSFTSSFSASWDTTGVSNGTHDVQAVVYDQYGLRGRSAIASVVVMNITPPDTTAPAQTTTLRAW